MDDRRDHLRALASGLTRLHALLMDRERSTYESRHGRVSSGELLQLLLTDERFAWLRPLSALLAQIDEAVDAEEPVTALDAERFHRATYRLVKSGDAGLFQDNYREALQESPDVVMAHAEVVRLLPRTRAH